MTTIMLIFNIYPVSSKYLLHALCYLTPKTIGFRDEDTSSKFKYPALNHTTYKWQNWDSYSALPDF